MPNCSLAINEQYLLLIRYPSSSFSHFLGVSAYKFAFRSIRSVESEFSSDSDMRSWKYSRCRE